MAVDHGLAEGLAPGEAVLRFYGWDRPTVSFGRNEPASRRYRREAPVDWVRRPTGGRAVLHRDELTYAVVFPAAAGLRRAYLQIHEALAMGLRPLGLAVGLAPASEAAPPTAPGACFSRPVGGELLTEGRKILGSAQARIGRNILQHGSLLRVEDQSGLASVALGHTASDAAGTTLAAALGRLPGDSELRSALAAGFAEALGVRLRSFEEERLGRYVDRHLPLYQSADWTWRY